MAERHSSSALRQVDATKSNSRKSGNGANGSHMGQHDEPGGRPHVLVVDDDASLGRLVRAILRTGGYDVEVTSNGVDALALVDRESVDVIVLDLRMPQLDGPEFFRELRARGHSTPVLLTSAYGAQHAQRELGAEGAIEKPFDPEALIDAVKELLPSGSA